MEGKLVLTGLIRDEIVAQEAKLYKGKKKYFESRDEGYICNGGNRELN